MSQVCYSSLTNETSMHQTGLTMSCLPRLNVVVLGLFQVALHLVLLRDVFVGVVQEFLLDGPCCGAQTLLSEIADLVQTCPTRFPP